MRKKRKIKKKILLTGSIVIILIILLLNIKAIVRVFTGNPLITPIESKTIKYITYNNTLFTIDIPKNWTVETTDSYKQFTFKAYNKENNLYQIFVTIKFNSFNKTQIEKDLWKKVYGDSNQNAKMPILSPQTVENFYKLYHDISIANNNKNFTYPEINNFSTIEILNDNILRATFTNNAGKTGEGLFTATIKNSNPYYVYGIDTSPLSVYNAIGITTPEGEMINWKEVLLKILSSISYSDTFINNINKEKDNELDVLTSNKHPYTELSSNITDAWNKHDISYDSIAGKRIDKILGYDRVINNETKKIYRAKDGWIDKHQKGMYSLVNDDALYSKPLSGYITK